MACACEGTRVTGALVPVSTPASTTPDFVPFTGPFNTADCKRVVWAFQVDGISGDAEVKFAYQVSDNPVSWSGGTALSESWITSNGRTYGNVDISADTNGNLYIRFGVSISNVAGSEPQPAMLGFEIEFFPF